MCEQKKRLQCVRRLFLHAGLVFIVFISHCPRICFPCRSQAAEVQETRPAEGPIRSFLTHGPYCVTEKGRKRGQPVVLSVCPHSAGGQAGLCCRMSVYQEVKEKQVSR